MEEKTGGTPIDVLADDVVRYILDTFVGDMDLGRCLLAWHRFHVLSVRSLQRRKYRCATVHSLCITGDVVGLGFALDNAETYVPAYFDWHAPLYAAVVADSVAMLDMLKGAIHAREADVRWPIAPIMWWALAFAAAQRGHDDVLAWLCLPCNATSSQPVASADAIRDLVPLADIGNALASDGRISAVSSHKARIKATLTLHSLFSTAVVERVRVSLIDVGRDARDALCDRISSRSGLDARAALSAPVFGISALDGPADGVADLDESDHQGTSADGGRWYGAMPYGAIRKSAHSIWKRAREKMRAFANPHVDRHKAGVWYYEVTRDSQGHADKWTLAVPASDRARVNGVKLTEPTWSGPPGAPFGPGHAQGEPLFWMMIIMDAVEERHIRILEMLRDCPVDKDDARPVSAALENGHLDVAAWLCAHGYNRVCVSHHLGQYDFRESTRPFLYEALCQRRFDVARVLLDPTAHEGIPRERIDSCIADAVATAVRDALASGNLAVVTWLRERHQVAVDEAVATVRFRQSWTRTTASERYGPAMRLVASLNT